MMNDTSVASNRDAIAIDVVESEIQLLCHSLPSEEQPKPFPHNFISHISHSSLHEFNPNLIFSITAQSYSQRG